MPQGECGQSHAFETIGAHHVSGHRRRSKRASDGLLQCCFFMQRASQSRSTSRPRDRRRKQRTNVGARRGCKTPEAACRTRGWTSPNLQTHAVDKHRAMSMPHTVRGEVKLHVLFPSSTGTSASDRGRNSCCINRHAEELCRLLSHDKMNERGSPNTQPRKRQRTIL
jgi:hypothetical protein